MGLVSGQMTLGNHSGSALDYGISTRSDNKEIPLDISKLKISMKINAQTGIIYGTEDKLKAYISNSYFINNGYYFDFMPMHNCMIEIVNKMMTYDSKATIEFLLNELKWVNIR